MLQLQDYVEAFVRLCCYFLLAALVLLGLDAKETWRGKGCWGFVVAGVGLFVHFLDFFHDLVSLLLQHLNVPCFFDDSLLQVFDLPPKGLIFRQKDDVLLLNRE